MAERVQTFIIDPAEIMNIDQIRQEELRCMDLICVFKTVQTLQWLAKRRLIHNSFDCEDCQTPMFFVKCPGCQDQHWWKCTLCEATMSVRANSFFAQSHSSLDQILMVVYCWSRKYSARHTMLEATIEKQAMKKLIYLCRQVCEEFVLNNPKVIDGPDKMLVMESDDFGSTFFETVWRNYIRNKNCCGQFLATLTEQYPV